MMTRDNLVKALQHQYEVTKYNQSVLSNILVDLYLNKLKALYPIQHRLKMKSRPLIDPRFFVVQRRLKHIFQELIRYSMFQSIDVLIRKILHLTSYMKEISSYTQPEYSTYTDVLFCQKNDIYILLAQDMDISYIQLYSTYGIDMFY